MLFLVANFSGRSVQPLIRRGREKVFENFSGLTPYKYFKEMSPIFAQVKCRSIFQRACRGDGHRENSKGIVGGWYERPGKNYRVAHSTLILAEQHCCNKLYQVVEYQKRVCFKGLAQDVMEDTNPDLNIMADTKDRNSSHGALCMDKS